jgi:hypothetical protein
MIRRHVAFGLHRASRTPVLFAWKHAAKPVASIWVGVIRLRPDTDGIGNVTASGQLLTVARPVW